MIGDPNLVPALKVIFKKGFPVSLTQAQSDLTPVTFYINRVTHMISASGYFCSLEIMDNITYNGGHLEISESARMQGG